jgi:hypothetical protein
VFISIQPASQAVPMDRTATFTVEAGGTAPDFYQWTRDNVDIPGATGACYTTAPVSFADSGAVFQVKVSNSTSSITSNGATLTAGPRAPALGDLRYLLSQQVTAPGLGNYGGEDTGITGADGFSGPNAVESPLVLGSNFDCDPGVPYDCGWRLVVEGLPPPLSGLTMKYQGGDYGTYASDFESLRSNAVIISFDLEPASSGYGVSWVETSQGGGFDYKLEVVPEAAIEATADADAANGRIITAASFDVNGKANLISYGWSGDTSTIYEAKTVVATAEDFVSTGTELASAG